MKRTLYFIITMSIILYPYLALRTQADNNHNEETSQLVIILTGFESEHGDAKVALSNSQQDYDSKTTAYRGGVAPIIDGTATITFSDLPQGHYAVKAFHDENGNGKIDLNFMGIPRENYGFSNNVRPTVGLPSFEKVKFEIDAPHREIEISLR